MRQTSLLLLGRTLLLNSSTESLNLLLGMSLSNEQSLVLHSGHTKFVSSTNVFVIPISLISKITNITTYIGHKNLAPQQGINTALLNKLFTNRTL